MLCANCKSMIPQGGGQQQYSPGEIPVENARGTGYTWHCNGHSFAGKLVMAEVDIRTVGELLGHKVTCDDDATYVSCACSQCSRRRQIGVS